MSSNVTGSIMQKDYFIRKHRKGSIGDKTSLGGNPSAELMPGLNKQSSSYIQGGSMIIEGVGGESSTRRRTNISKQD